MDNILDELERSARRCERHAAQFESDEVTAVVERIVETVNDFDRAWSQSFLGYQADVYTAGFEPTKPGQHFDSQWGGMDRFSNRSSGEWAEYDHDAVIELVFQTARIERPSVLDSLAKQYRDELSIIRDNITPLLDALAAMLNDAKIRDVRDRIAKLKSSYSAEQLFSSMVPKGRQFTHDMRAMQGGFRCPPHLQAKINVLVSLSYGEQLKKLGVELSSLVKYLRLVKDMSGNTIAKRSGKIFIGHGNSEEWKNLKDFLADRLSLTWDEFNREPNAGRTTKERLESMLDDACFAFLVMTGEDETGDGRLVARQNVVHEIGLFQGRLGFNRAIVLLEESCEEFSNIVGLTQIRFPRGKLLAKSEDIRRVLEREKLL